MKFWVEIKNRWTGSVISTAEITCCEDASYGVKLGLAVKESILNGADLTEANLRGADLTGANLAEANLAGANLGGANLKVANLRGADLKEAHLMGSFLSWANLSGANLSGANLSWANLSWADLKGADLAGANLSGVSLELASIAGAKWYDGIIITHAPMQIHGLAYPVTILDAHMQIGCELHRLADWEVFDDERIARMGGAPARRFWNVWRAPLLEMARADGRSFASAVAPEVGESVIPSPEEVA